MSAPHEHPAGSELLRRAKWIRSVARALVPDEATAEDIPTLVYVWDGPGEATCLAPFGGDKEGNVRLDRVPAGTGRLAIPVRGSMNPDEWETVREVEIPVGGELSVALD